MKKLTREQIKKINVQCKSARELKDINNSIINYYFKLYESWGIKINVLCFPKKTSKKTIKRYLKIKNINDCYDPYAEAGDLSEEIIRINKYHVYIISVYNI